jgi:hypothetical protein
VDNFVDKHCEDELSARRALFSMGNIPLDKSIFFLYFKDLREKIELCEPASGGEPRGSGRRATLCISQADRRCSARRLPLGNVSADYGENELNA